MAPIKRLPKKNVIEKVNMKRDEAKSNKDKMEWMNKERVLVFCQRGINFRARHLMLDLRTLMPHSRQEREIKAKINTLWVYFSKELIKSKTKWCWNGRTICVKMAAFTVSWILERYNKTKKNSIFFDNKLDRKDKLSIINEVCEMKNCNKCIFFEMRKKKDLYMWVSNVPHGPSARFFVENVHTMDELKLTGNCLKGSRPILSFDKKFTENVQFLLLKEMFSQAFATPNLHPKSKPFVDRVMTFSIVDRRIWIRNYQIVDQRDFSLTEIGPRFVLNVIRIFSGSFCGSTIYENPHYVSPNEHRRNMRRVAAVKYIKRQHTKADLNEKLTERVNDVEESLDDIFCTFTQADLNKINANQ